LSEIKVEGVDNTSLMIFSRSRHPCRAVQLGGAVRLQKPASSGIEQHAALAGTGLAFKEKAIHTDSPFYMSDNNINLAVALKCGFCSDLSIE
jgi:hypothetical protein